MKVSLVRIQVDYYSREFSSLRCLLLWFLSQHPILFLVSTADHLDKCK